MRGKDDEKIMEPMFPRLHVNDTEKGGPRAPPRNKMALYEQLSIPSQRFNPSNTSNSIPPTSSSQGSNLERNMHFPSYSTSTNPATHHLGGVSANARVARFESRKKTRDENDFAVPVFLNSETGQQHSRIKDGFDGGKLENVCDGDSNRGSSSGVGSRKEVRDQTVEGSKACTSRERSIKTAADLSTREAIDGCPKEDSVSPNQDSGEIPVSRSSRSPENDASSVQKLRARRQEVENGCTDAAALMTAICECREDKTCGSLELANGEKSDNVSESSMVDSVSSLDISPDDVVGIIGQKRFWKARRAIVKYGFEGGRSNDLEFLSKWHLSLFRAPQFRINRGSSSSREMAILSHEQEDEQWRTIPGANVGWTSEEVQVFELHRLIKVQRLIAGSPHLLLEGVAYLGKPSLNDSSAKKLPPELIVKPLPQNKRKDDTEKLSRKMECSAENVVGWTSLSSVKNGSQPSNYGPFLGNPPLSAANGDNKMNPWCFNQMLEQQWLVPVMSPSEGLIYKPYPVPGLLMGSVCGGCGPYGQTPMIGNFMASAYGGQAPPHQGHGILPGAPLSGHSYFPPYGMPVMNPALSGSAMEQMNQFSVPGSHAPSGQVSASGANFYVQHQNSCNMPSKNNTKFQASKDTEQERCTASSPGERAEKNRTGSTAEGKNAPPLLPTGQAIQDGALQPRDTDRRTRVIRVVPHNPRSATESVARIFQSIQRERKLCD
ncbi:Detected protein of unknown function [Hibiscus syriacus]|uniref:Uncharacterized protein n=1 Tax=Hibiscus syriacus TaxID=106335 RepID=A0A6A2XH27_HIBSY|nr:Detected protein of unknown function [Hibiscus syriacus]